MVKILNTRSTPQADLDEVRANNKAKQEKAEARKVQGEMAATEEDVVIDGLDHLEGEPVEVLVEEKPAPDEVVEDDQEKVGGE